MKTAGRLLLMVLLPFRDGDCGEGGFGGGVLLALDKGTNRMHIDNPRFWGETPLEANSRPNLFG